MNQSEAMRRIAGDDKIYVAEDRGDGWHGVELVNHPTPSGCRRLMKTFSDNRGWPTEEKAIEVIKAAMKKLDESYAEEDAKREAKKG